MGVDKCGCNVLSRENVSVTRRRTHENGIVSMERGPNSLCRALSTLCETVTTQGKMELIHESKKETRRGERDFHISLLR